MKQSEFVTVSNWVHLRNMLQEVQSLVASDILPQESIKAIINNTYTLLDAHAARTNLSLEK